MSERDAPRAYRLAVAFALDLAVAFALGVVAFMLCGFAWAATHAGVQGPEGMHRLSMPGPLAEVLSTVAAMGAAAAGLLFWRRRPSREEWRRSLAAARLPSTWGTSALAAAILAIVVIGLGVIATGFGLQVEPSNDATLRALQQTHPALLWGFAVVLAPVYEEVVFRRVVYGRFAEAGLPRAGLLVSAASFALAHEMPGLGTHAGAASLMLWLVYAIMGLAFALVYRRCGTLWAAILTHALHNAVSLLLL